MKYLFICILLLYSCKNFNGLSRQNKNWASYINSFISCATVGEDNNLGDSIYCENIEADTLSTKLTLYTAPQKNTEPLEVVKKILQKMSIGGATPFMQRYLLSTTDGNGNYFSQHHIRRIDFALFYYLYYDFFLEEKNPKFHNIVLVGQKDSLSNCYGEENGVSFYGNPNKIYPILENDESNILLFQLYNCFSGWIKKVEKIGWTKAKEQKISPFDNCPCYYRRLPNDKAHFSRFPRVE